MNPRSLKNLLEKANFEFSDLGDGTAALISLDSGKIITLNELGTQVVESINKLDKSSYSEESLIEDLASELAGEYEKSIDEVTCDINNFISGLIKSLS